MQVMRKPAKDFKERPASGCLIHGLFLEGARFDHENYELGESRPKELYTDMPVMWLKPTENRVPPKSGFYECPVYKTLQRAGTALCVAFLCGPTVFKLAAFTLMKIGVKCLSQYLWINVSWRMPRFSYVAILFVYVITSAQVLLGHTCV